jgi:periplasmic divalent cation tolerance protein
VRQDRRVAGERVGGPAELRHGAPPGGRSRRRTIWLDSVNGPGKARPVKVAHGLVIVLVTAPDLKTARRLARAIVRERLAACANIIPRIESHYRWRNKLESSGEALLIFKTARAKLAALEKAVLDRHPYDTPEVIVVPLAAGNARYLEWLGTSLRADPRG